MFWVSVLPGNKDSPRKPVDCLRLCVCMCMRVFLYYLTCLPVLEMAVLAHTFLPPCSCCIPVAGSMAGWNAWVLPFSKLAALWPKALSSLCFPYLCQSRGLVAFSAHLTSAQFKAGACSLSVVSYLSRLCCAKKSLSGFIYKAPSLPNLTHIQTSRLLLSF